MHVAGGNRPGPFERPGRNSLTHKSNKVKLLPGFKI